MISAASLMCCLLLGGQSLDTRFMQASPAGADLERSPGQERAVVLIHGLRVQPFSSRKVRQADFQLWQKPGSRLVEALATQADVYAFAYSQNVDVEAIAAEGALARHVQALENAGYEEIVLIGHSAGGLIARQFVEDHPGAGVTKVIQVCTPNGGSTLGKLSLGVCALQEPFLDSLTKQARREALARRADKQIPEHVEFVCLVGQLQVDVEADLGSFWDEMAWRVACSGTLCGDGILSVPSQWPEDLRKQGIPAHPLRAAHFTAMFLPATARQLTELIRQGQPRWNAEQVAAAEQAMDGVEWFAEVHAAQDR